MKIIRIITAITRIIIDARRRRWRAWPRRARSASSTSTCKAPPPPPPPPRRKQPKPPPAPTKQIYFSIQIETKVLFQDKRPPPPLRRKQPKPPPASSRRIGPQPAPPRMICPKMLHYIYKTLYYIHIYDIISLGMASRPGCFGVGGGGGRSEREGGGGRGRGGRGGGAGQSACPLNRTATNGECRRAAVASTRARRALSTGPPGAVGLRLQLNSDSRVAVELRLSRSRAVSGECRRAGHSLSLSLTHTQLESLSS